VPVVARLECGTEPTMTDEQYVELVVNTPFNCIFTTHNWHISCWLQKWLHPQRRCVGSLCHKPCMTRDRCDLYELVKPRDQMAREWPNISFTTDNVPVVYCDNAVEILPSAYFPLCPWWALSLVNSTSCEYRLVSSGIAKFVYLSYNRS